MSAAAEPRHGGEHVVAALAAHGVEEIFTLSGGHVFPVYDACVKAGLPIYQYLAIASVLTGVGLTMLGGSPAPAPSSPADPALVAAAALVGLVYWFAMGVDFPESNRRFARLSG